MCKKHELNPYDLPVVPCMIRPTYTEDVAFVKTLIEDLCHRAEGDITLIWALETITELQFRWFVAVDKLMRIEAIARSE